MFYSCFSRELFWSQPCFFEAPPPEGWIPVSVENDRPSGAAVLRLKLGDEGVELKDGAPVALWESLPESPGLPDAAAFYNALASCDEYGAVFGYAVANPTTPIPFLICIVIDVTTEAKSYQQSGGQDVAFDRVDAAIRGLIAALPDEVGDISKTDIIAKIKQIAADNYVFLPSL